MDVIEIIMDMFETERTNTLSFKTDLDPLRGLLPVIFREGPGIGDAGATVFRRRKFRE